MSTSSPDYCSGASDVSPTGTHCPVLWQRKHARASCSVRALLPLSLSLIPRRIPMRKPDLRLLAQWLDPALVSVLEDRRRRKKEWQRRRKLATVETLWLMLAVSLDTHRASLYEILRLATGQLAIQWSISVAAFCKARAHFSPGRSVLAAWRAGIAAAKSLQGRPQPLARAAPACWRQDHSHFARIPIPLEVFWRTQGPAGIGGDCGRALLPV